MDLEREPAGSPPADSSTQPGVQSAGSPPASQDAHADSSPREESREPISESPSEYQDGLLEAITKVAQPEPEPAPETDNGQGADTPDQEEQEGPADPQADTEGDLEASEPEAEEAKDEQLPFGKHPRFRQVIRERNEYRNMAQEYRPHAEEYRKIESFMQNSNLDPREVAEGFEIMALMKRDPFTARQRMAQYMGYLDQLTGNGGLPQDLNTDLERGYVTEARAREIAALRAHAEFQGQRAAEERTMAMQRQAQAVQAQAIQQQSQAVRAWSQDLAKRDPDYPLIRNDVADKLSLLSLHNEPQTPEQAVALAKQAYDSVKGNLKRYRERKQEISPAAADNMTGNSPSSRPEPKSFLDAVMMAARQN
jgi:hypothetical protein